MLILRARAVPERRELPFLSRAARSSSLTTDSASTDCRRCACWHAPLQHRRGVRGSERAAQRPDDRVDRPRRCRCEASAQPLHPSTQTRRLVSHTSHWDHCRTPRRSRSSTRRGARDISHPTPFLPCVAPPFPPYVNKTFFLLDQALATLRTHLPKNAWLVGQNILKDVQWLGLVEGVDFAAQVDLAALLRVFNPRFGSYTYFGQDHYVRAWLGEEAARGEGDSHDALADARCSMMLFQAYRRVQHDPKAVAAIGARALSTRARPSFAKLNPEFEGVCMGNRQTCKCGAPFFS